MKQETNLAALLQGWGHPSTALLETLGELYGDAAVFAVDADRNIVYWGPGGERLLGFRAEEVLGEHCLKANRCETCMVGCGVAQHGRIREAPLTCYAADGRAVPVRKSAQAFYDANGEFAGAIEVLAPMRAGRTDPPPNRSEVTRFHGLVTRDPTMRRAFETVRAVAETDATVLIRGESGTGKEWIARGLHAESHRKQRAFVAVNCAALTPALIESELFGHVQGAFTGAVRNRDGLFVQADGGTLFLDEVAELPLDVQAKLLRVLESGEVLPVGSSQARSVDVRIVAATHKSLREEMARGRFREDLLYRLRVVPIYLPALRERRADIEVLLWHFIENFNQRGPRQVRSVAPEVMRALLSHDFPGNVRELRNVVEFAFAVGRDSELTVDDLTPGLVQAHAQPPNGPGVDAAEAEERARFAEALERAGGRVGDAAEALGMSRATFWRKRRKLGL